VNIPFVHEDDWLLIADKPAGLLTIPTPRKETRTLTSILNEELKQKGAPYRLYPCHRLDRETSGLIIYAKGKSVQKRMMDEFKSRRIKKTYIALVQGHMQKSRGTINIPVDGRAALTQYSVMRQAKDFDVVEAAPLTGRKNQIRIHFKSLGHPLVGETRFAFRRDYKLRAKRVLLHAKSLEFTHPFTKKVIRLDCGLGRDLEEFIARQDKLI